jgi:translation initiation factor 1
MNKDDIVFSYTLGGKLNKYDNGKEIDKKYSSPDDGFVRIRLEKNKRGGKTVTVIYGFKDETDLAGLCTILKKKCGSGGTVKSNHIEIQGDKKDIVEKHLIQEGYKVKIAGG